ncbi:hypothetical protein GE061_013359 [Apolygus lucorum]|uniref:Uncharacterized protein n=1 Tax=Apolygus lucorum TaxID=248454 RepID=A0A6A4K4X3_APOLU|nr:hypothetical protein GE061_013359 [Apolygus lucorum]
MPVQYSPGKEGEPNSSSKQTTCEAEKREKELEKLCLHDIELWFSSPVKKLIHLKQPRADAGAVLAWEGGGAELQLEADNLRGREASHKQMPVQYSPGKAGEPNSRSKQMACEAERREKELEKLCLHNVELWFSSPVKKLIHLKQPRADAGAVLTGEGGGAELPLEADGLRGREASRD